MPFSFSIQEFKSVKKIFFFAKILIEKHLETPTLTQFLLPKNKTQSSHYFSKRWSLFLVNSTTFPFYFKPKVFQEIS